MISQQTCLIVEDSDVVRKVTRHVIESLGFSVNDVATTDEALARCKREMPDLIVLDWHILGSLPIDFIAAVRSLPLGRQPKILYVITNNDPAEIGRALTAGANDYLLKPFQKVNLEAKVAALTTRMRDASDDADYVQLQVRTALGAAR